MISLPHYSNTQLLTQDISVTSIRRPHRRRKLERTGGDRSNRQFLPARVLRIVSLLQVRFEQTVVRESHPTNVTNVRLFLRVNTLMDPVSFVWLEPFSAHFALVVPGIWVHCGVLFEPGAWQGRQRNEFKWAIDYAEPEILTLSGTFCRTHHRRTSALRGFSCGFAGLPTTGRWHHTHCR